MFFCSAQDLAEDSSGQAGIVSDLPFLCVSVSTSPAGIRTSGRRSASENAPFSVCSENSDLWFCLGIVLCRFTGVFQRRFSDNGEQSAISVSAKFSEVQRDGGLEVLNSTNFFVLCGPVPYDRTFLLLRHLGLNCKDLRRCIPLCGERRETAVPPFPACVRHRFSGNSLFGQVRGPL